MSPKCTYHSSENKELFFWLQDRGLAWVWRSILSSTSTCWDHRVTQVSRYFFTRLTNSHKFVTLDSQSHLARTLSSASDSIRYILYFIHLATCTLIIVSYLRVFWLFFRLKTCSHRSENVFPQSWSTTSSTRTQLVSLNVRPTTSNVTALVSILTCSETPVKDVRPY